VVDLLRDPATRVVTLRGSGPSAQGRVVWHDTEGGHVFLTKLPPAPEGTAYALWAISAGRPRSAGLFQADQAGQATQRVAPVGRPVEAFTVTLEPVGGVPAPTGRVVLGSGPTLPGGAARLGGDRAPPTGQPAPLREDEGQRPQPEPGSGERPTDDDRPVPSGG
jgi:anti-sigma-K factor RskA